MYDHGGNQCQQASSKPKQLEKEQPVVCLSLFLSIHRKTDHKVRNLSIDNRTRGDHCSPESTCCRAGLLFGRLLFLFACFFARFLLLLALFHLHALSSILTSARLRNMHSCAHKSQSGVRQVTCEVNGSLEQFYEFSAVLGTSKQSNFFPILFLKNGSKCNSVRTAHTMKYGTFPKLFESARTVFLRNKKRHLYIEYRCLTQSQAALPDVLNGLGCLKAALIPLGEPRKLLAVLRVQNLKKAETLFILFSMHACTVATFWSFTESSCSFSGTYNGTVEG